MKKPAASTAAGVPAAPESLVVADEPTDEVDPVVCLICGGPARLCGGASFCAGGPKSKRERRWLVAVRAVYAGLLLTTTPAALWGGTLLRLARLLAHGEPPPRILRVAAEYADPECALAPTDAATFALAYLQHGDISSLQKLRPLRDARAPWLAVLCALGRRAALTTPLEAKGYALIAVACDACAARADASTPLRRTSLRRLVAHVGSFDAAIRCPECAAVVPHPLPGIEIREPHPVGRCVGGATRRCMAHLGDELDAEGLCSEGRAVYGQAVAEIAGRTGSPGARDRDLVDALLRAQRRPVLPPFLLPVFAALAKADPEAARALAHINGAPLDTEAADPDLIQRLKPRPGIARVLNVVEEAVEHGFQTLLEEFGASATGRRGCGPKFKRTSAR